MLGMRFFRFVLFFAQFSGNTANDAPQSSTLSSPSAPTCTVNANCTHICNRYAVRRHFVCAMRLPDTGLPFSLLQSQLRHSWTQNHTRRRRETKYSSSCDCDWWLRRSQQQLRCRLRTSWTLIYSVCGWIFQLFIQRMQHLSGGIGTFH